jgi:hypothetical protein
MRLWSLHPRYLDRQGLTAAWREGLLAQAVLAGRTRGYRHHPQLQRFRELADPSHAVGSYLCGLVEEADRRGYRYDRSKVERSGPLGAAIPVTSGQLAHEWGHLVRKLELRSLAWLAALGDVRVVEPHPLFVVVEGPVASWEVVTTHGSAGRQ